MQDFFHQQYFATAPEFGQKWSLVSGRSQIYIPRFHISEFSVNSLSREVGVVLPYVISVTQKMNKCWKNMACDHINHIMSTGKLIFLNSKKKQTNSSATC